MAIAGHILLALPFVLLTMTAALDRFRFSLLEAARDLGASRIRAFWTITFPLVLPAVLGAILLAAAVSIDEFIIAFFNTGSDGTLPLVIYARIRRVIDPGLNALATILLVATTLLAVLAARTDDGTEMSREMTTPAADRHPVRGRQQVLRASSRPSATSTSRSARASSSRCSGPSGCGKTTSLRMLAGFEDARLGADPAARRGRDRTCRRTGARSTWCSSTTSCSRT